MSFSYKTSDKLEGMLSVNVDDTLSVGTENFKLLTDEIPKHFGSNPLEYTPIFFSGILCLQRVYVGILEA